jgi:hypothetical protein
VEQIVENKRTFSGRIDENSHGDLAVLHCVPQSVLNP